MLIYEADLYNGSDDWDLIEGEKIISNGEITLSNATQIRYIPVDLLHYSRYIIDFELYSSSDNRIHIGVANGTSDLRFWRDTNTTHVRIGDLYAKDYMYNDFEAINKWRNFRIINNLTKSSVTIENNRYDINYPIKGRYLYLRKWLDEYIKVRNIRITIIKSLTYKCNRSMKSFSICIIFETLLIS